MKKYIYSFLFLGLFAVSGLGASVSAYTQISSQLDIGERNGDVTNLQTFFADNPNIYPEGLVTGYFGNLTSNAVKNFQSQSGIAQVGRVGPVTRDAINNLIVTGGWRLSDVSGPAIYNVAMTQSANSANFTFNTNEGTNARIVFHASPILFNEGDINSNGFSALGGFSSNSSNIMSNYHSVGLSGLQSNTVYYYTVIATDAVGNISVFGPNHTFRTN